MERLLEDVLAAARNGKIVAEMRPISLAEVGWAAWETLETGPHDLVVDTDATVRASDERLQALLENLFRNAITHGVPDEPTDSDDADAQSLTITVSDLVDDHGRPDGFAVSDNGVGIPEDHRDSIFETGYTTSSEGTGFGLAIVEAIVDAHRWSISLAEHGGDDEGADDGGGTTFEIRDVDFQSPKRS